MQPPNSVLSHVCDVDLRLPKEDKSCLIGATMRSNLIAWSFQPLYVLASLGGTVLAMMDYRFKTKWYKVARHSSAHSRPLG